MNRKNDDKIACFNAELFNSIGGNPAVRVAVFQNANLNVCFSRKQWYGLLLP